MRRDTSSATDDREVWQPFASLEHAGELPRTSRREDEGREDGGQARAADVPQHVPACRLPAMLHGSIVWDSAGQLWPSSLPEREG